MTSTPESSAAIFVKAEPTLEQKVGAIAKDLTRGEDGKYKYPDDLTPELKLAVTSERRRRDGQIAIQSATEEVSILREENKGLISLVALNSSATITEEEATELETLKFSDPDAWRIKVNEIELRGTTELDSQVNDISDKAKVSGAVQNRTVLLDAFLDENPGLVITQDVIDNDVPPRITKQLETGELTFLEFLTSVKEYLGTGKVIANATAEETLNLTDIGGGSTPELAALNKEGATVYETSVF